MGLLSMLGGGAYSKVRSHFSTVTLVIAFILSIFVIHNTNKCENNKGYPKDRGFVNTTYRISVTVLVLICVLFALDIFFAVTRFSPL